MLETWIVPSAIVVAFALLLLAPLIEPALRSVRSVRFRCPFVGRAVAVTFEERTALGLTRPVGVASCSAFDDPAAITCGRRCLAGTDDTG